MSSRTLLTIYVAVALITWFSIYKIWEQPNLNLRILQTLILILVLTAAFIDAFYMVIPNRLLMLFFPPFILCQMLTGHLLEGLLGGMLAFAILFLLTILSKGGLGGGDIKMLALLGIGLGIHGILNLLFLSCLIAFLIGAVERIKGILSKGEPSPFAPYIMLATLLMLNLRIT